MGYFAAPQGSGGSAPFRGARGWSITDYFETAAAACPGSAAGFEVTCVAIVEDLRDVTNILLSAWDSEFVGPGYQLFFDTIRADLKIKSTSGAVLQQGIGNRWIDDYQGYVLVVLSGGYNAATNSWFLRLSDIELFDASLGGGFTFVPATGPLRMGTGSYAPTNLPATNSIVVAAAYKGGGVLSAAERREVMQSVLANKDLPDVSFTNRWSFATAPLGAGYVSPLVDQIGAANMTVTGSVEIVDVDQVGRPTMGTGLTTATISEGGFMTTTQVASLTTAAAAAAAAAPTTLLWEWNGLDTTQFDTVKTYARSGDGANTAVSRALSVSAAPWGGGNQLVMSVDTQRGGCFWPILGLAPGDDYLIEMEFCEASASWIGIGNPTLMLFAADTAGVIRGASLDPTRNTGNGYLSAIWATAYQNFNLIALGNVWTQPSVSRGARWTVAVSRQTGGGGNAKWRVWAKSEIGGAPVGGADVAGSRNSIQDRAAVDNGNWDGINMALVGPGIYVGSSPAAGVTISFGIRYMRIWSKKYVHGA
jgi:hypothetical protein